MRLPVLRRYEATTAEQLADRRHAVVLIITCLARFVVVLDGTSVIIALPAIQRGLRFQPDDLSWVMNSYILLFGGLLLLGGHCVDHFGSRRTLLIGITLFSLGSLVSAVSWAPLMLIASRAGQGMAAALMTPAALSVLTSTFHEGQKRHGALAAWGAVGGIASVSGLIVGGVLTQVFSWHAVFLINVPTGIGLVLGTCVLVPRTPRTSRTKFNPASSLLSTAGVVALVYATMSVSHYGWDSPNTLGPLSISFVFLGIAAYRLLVRARGLVRTSLRSLRQLLLANSAMFVASGPAVVVLYFTTTFLQDVKQFSPLESGAAFIPASVALLTGSALTYRLSRRFTSRAILAAGLILLTIGLAALAQVTPHSQYGLMILPAIVIAFAGIGLVFVNCTIHATADGAGLTRGTASGLINATQQVGTAIWLAVFSSLAVSQTVVQARSEPIGTITTAGYHVVYWTAAGLTLVAIPIAACFRTRDTIVKNTVD